MYTIENALFSNDSQYNKKKKHKLLKYTLFNSNKVLKSLKLSKIIDKNK